MASARGFAGFTYASERGTLPHAVAETRDWSWLQEEGWWGGEEVSGRD